MKKNKTRAQAATEYIIIAGFVLIITAAILFLAMSSLDNSNNDALARIAVEKIANTANQVASLGAGTTLTCEVQMPYGVDLYLMEDKLVGIVVDQGGKNAHYYADTTATLEGSFPITEGTHTITFTMQDDGNVLVN